MSPNVRISRRASWRELKNVSTDVSIASLYMSFLEIGRSKKGLILLAQMKREKLKKGLPQIFQSCTFNRSVTSPLNRSLKHGNPKKPFVTHFVQK